uniref:Uncharacterized protein n=1 Tax=Candidatus Entotheonella serta TaxID=1652106 RepID=A0A0K0PDC4_9BACT|nr:hypothetical protein [Candidatus Entotheonella serta]
MQHHINEDLHLPEQIWSGIENSRQTLGLNCREAFQGID